MKKVLLFLIFLLIPIISFASDFEGYIFVETPFDQKIWVQSLDGYWHIDKGSEAGLKGIFKYDYMKFCLKDGLIIDSLSPDFADNDNRLGLGIVGNDLEASLRLGDPSKLFKPVLLFTYGVKCWFVHDERYGYEYLVSKNAVIQSLTLSAEMRIF